MNPLIFREYDIRGIADEDFTEADVERLGRAVGTFLGRRGCRRLTVGRDCRLTSDRYAERLMAGLCAAGITATDIGVCPTPVLYFSIPHFRQDGGVMITASHNPGHYNGFKICQGLDSVHGDDIQRIAALIREEDFDSGTGVRRAADAVTPYTAHLTANLKLARPMRIAVDAGNGTAGPLAVPILRALAARSRRSTVRWTGPSRTTKPTPPWSKTCKISSPRCATAASIWASASTATATASAWSTSAAASSTATG